MNKKLKWLEYFGDNFGVGEIFLESLNLQLQDKIESLVGGEIDWNKVWLFFEPISSAVHYDSDLSITYVYCQLIYGKIELTIDLCFKYLFKNEVVDFEEMSTINDPFECTITRFEDPQNVKHLFIKSENSEKPDLELMKIGNLTLVSKSTLIPHEGYFILPKLLFELNTLKSILSTIQYEWNEEGLPTSGKNGFVHQLLIEEEVDDNFQIYFDLGSADVSVIKFIVESLSKQIDSQATIVMSGV